jgi:ABC-2 type transport system permease protein
MNWRIIKTVVGKDMMLLFKDRLFGFVTILSVIIYIVFYLIMPRTLDETIEIGFYAPLSPLLFNRNMESEGVVVRSFNTDQALKQAVMDKKFNLGISIPEGLWKSAETGEKPKIYVYYASDTPGEIKEMYTIFIGEMIQQMTGSGLRVEDVEIVLGPDMGGRQIPYRDRLIPMFIFMLLLTEAFGLANLITSELESGTLQALLITPMRITDLFAGKGITGVVLSFTQSLVLLAFMGGLSQNVSLILCTLLLGSVMVTGIAFLIGSVSKDMMSALAWITLVIIVFAIPAVSILFPGPVSGWIKVIPSFYMVDTLHRAVNFNIGWTGNTSNLISLAGFNVVFIFLGIFSLKRKLT